MIWLSWSESSPGRASRGARARAGGAAERTRDQGSHGAGRLLDAEAMALEELGDTARPGLAYERAREVFAQSGYAPGVASVENHLGNLDLSAGDLSAAAAHFSRARTTAEGAGDGASVAMAALNLALVDHLEGRRERARELFVDALITNQACGDRANVAFSIFGLAVTELEDSRAAELHGSASHRLAQLDIMLSALEERFAARSSSACCASLGPERFDRALGRGHELLVEDIVGAVV